MEQQKNFGVKGGQHEHDYDLLKKIYEEWRPKNAIMASNDKHEFNYRDPRWPAHYKMAFNEQVKSTLSISLYSKIKTTK